ncbi:MBL fold metallo-hydrolase [Methanothermobacter marburgensis]|uniref:Predicted hydrolase n=1 Tax=Methanothermobacter marburgensis (strain ATCC BAA-927 / DSM 2133 / JCM 14651 / NBRC 100331 / OCM 82 / Marburg) TaxID=79929 RepID=D9PXW2_METTM|nr:rhodanese-like domain-containing protein [Methanothermobacter marburgensis]ADL59060.1 predicted hydrolase [Methanothermobacter marburgensis str. Marburg]WBF10750.1 MBL fold metallo-hydrolase [Methanothermobacter marburgensis]
MIFEIIRSEGLSHNSYFLASGGEAAVVDPRRDVDVYLELAEKNSVNIRYIFETHRNEDYTIGSVELARYVDAEILHGAHLDFEYGTAVVEGDTFRLGNLELEVLETPGHTYESISVAVRDTTVSDECLMVFTGDVLFAGETGRVDFFGPEKIPETAGLLYDSIHEKIIPLGDHVVVCPAHGAGSVCGADIRDMDTTTVGYERLTNPYLQMGRDEFTEHKISERLYTPPYFRRMEENNLRGAPVENPNLEALPVPEFRELLAESAQVVDVRNPTSFSSGHIPGSLNIWQDGFAAFAGYFLNYDDPVLVVDDGRGVESVRRSLIRLGYDNMAGYLAGGFPSWYMAGLEFNAIRSMSVHELRELEGDIFLLDVRKITDRERFHIEGSEHIWVGDLPDNVDMIPEKDVVIYCDSGYKSTIAASILESHGFSTTTVLGGIGAWLRAGYPVVEV